MTCWRLGVILDRKSCASPSPAEKNCTCARLAMRRRHLQAHICSRARRYRRGRLLRAQTPPERLRLSKRRSETVSPFHSTALPAAITEARTFRLCMLSPAPPPNRKTKSQTLRKHRHEGGRERRHEYMHTRGACAELPRTSASRCLGACRFKERLVRAQRAHTHGRFRCSRTSALPSGTKEGAGRGLRVFTSPGCSGTERTAGSAAARTRYLIMAPQRPRPATSHRP